MTDYDLGYMAKHIPKAPRPSRSRGRGSRTYTVLGGESWASIAGKVYGDQRHLGTLMRANPHKFYLHPGDVLRLPPRQAKPYVSEHELFRAPSAAHPGYTPSGSWRGGSQPWKGGKKVDTEDFWSDPEFLMGLLDEDDDQISTQAVIDQLTGAGVSGDQLASILKEAGITPADLPESVEDIEPEDRARSWMDNLSGQDLKDLYNLLSYPQRAQEYKEKLAQDATKAADLGRAYQQAQRLQDDRVFGPYGGRRAVEIRAEVYEIRKGIEEAKERDDYQEEQRLLRLLEPLEEEVQEILDSLEKPEQLDAPSVTQVGAGPSGVGGVRVVETEDEEITYYFTDAGGREVMMTPASSLETLLTFINQITGAGAREIVQRVAREDPKLHAAGAYVSSIVRSTINWTYRRVLWNVFSTPGLGGYYCYDRHLYEQGIFEEKPKGERGSVEDPKPDEIWVRKADVVWDEIERESQLRQEYLESYEEAGQLPDDPRPPLEYGREGVQGGRAAGNLLSIASATPESIARRRAWEEEQRLEIVHKRQVAYGLLAEIQYRQDKFNLTGDPSWFDGITDLLEQAETALTEALDADTWVRSGISDPYTGATWAKFPHRKVAFLKALVEAELQKGEPLTNGEIRRIRQFFINPTLELGADFFYDVTALLPLEKVFQPLLNYGKRSVKWVVSSIDDAVGGHASRILAATTKRVDVLDELASRYRNIGNTGAFVDDASERILDARAQKVFDEASRTILGEVVEFNEENIARMAEAVYAQQVDDTAETFLHLGADEWETTSNRILGEVVEQTEKNAAKLAAAEMGQRAAWRVIYDKPVTVVSSIFDAIKSQGSRSIRERVRSSMIDGLSAYMRSMPDDNGKSFVEVMRNISRLIAPVAGNRTDENIEAMLRALMETDLPRVGLSERRALGMLLENADFARVAKAQKLTPIQLLTKEFDDAIIDIARVENWTKLASDIAERRLSEVVSAQIDELMRTLTPEEWAQTSMRYLGQDVPYRTLPNAVRIAQAIVEVGAIKVTNRELVFEFAGRISDAAWRMLTHAETGLVEESLLRQILAQIPDKKFGTALDNPVAQTFAKSGVTLGRYAKNAWITAVLTTRPGWAFRNLMDSTFRAIIHGINPFESLRNTIKLMDDLLDEELQLAQVEATFVRSVAAREGATMGKRILTGEVKSIAPWTLIGLTKDEWVKIGARKGMDTWRPIIRGLYSPWRGIQALAGGVGDLSSGIEFALRAQLITTKFFGVYTSLSDEILELSLRTFAAAGADDDALLLARTIAQKARLKPESAAEMIRRLRTGGLQGRQVYSLLLPEEITNELVKAGYSAVQQERFIRPILLRVEDLQHRALRERLDSIPVQWIDDLFEGEGGILESIEDVVTRAEQAKLDIVGKDYDADLLRNLDELGKRLDETPEWDEFLFGPVVEDVEAPPVVPDAEPEVVVSRVDQARNAIRRAIQADPEKAHLLDELLEKHPWLNKELPPDMAPRIPTTYLSAGDARAVGTARLSSRIDELLVQSEELVVQGGRKALREAQEIQRTLGRLQKWLRDVDRAEAAIHRFLVEEWPGALRIPAYNAPGVYSRNQAWDIFHSVSEKLYRELGDRCNLLVEAGTDLPKWVDETSFADVWEMAGLGIRFSEDGSIAALYHAYPLVPTIRARATTFYETIDKLLYYSFGDFVEPTDAKHLLEAPIIRLERDVATPDIAEWVTSSLRATDAVETGLEEAGKRADDLLRQRYGAYYAGAESGLPMPDAIPPSPHGWKLHLTVGEENLDEVEQILNDMGLNFKRGGQGEQVGKDFTIYVGARDEATRVADELSGAGGDLFDTPVGDVLRDDIELADNVMARFDIGGHDPEFHQYGVPGHPVLQTDMQNRVFAQEAETKARQLLDDWVVNDPRVQRAIRDDPIFKALQEHNPKLADELRKGRVTAQELLEAIEELPINIPGSAQDLISALDEAQDVFGIEIVQRIEGRPTAAASVKWSEWTGSGLVPLEVSEIGVNLPPDQLRRVLLEEIAHIVPKIEDGKYVTQLKALFDDLGVINSLRNGADWEEAMAEAFVRRSLGEELPEEIGTALDEILDAEPYLQKALTQVAETGVPKVDESVGLLREQYWSAIKQNYSWEGYGPLADSPESLRQYFSRQLAKIDPEKHPQLYEFYKNEIDEIDYLMTIFNDNADSLGATQVPLMRPGVRPVRPSRHGMPDEWKQAVWKMSYADQANATTLRVAKQWHQYLRQGVEDASIYLKVLPDDILQLLEEKWLPEFVEGRQRAINIALYGSGDDIVSELGYTVEGALPNTQRVMLDYQNYSQLDQIIKENLFPFWMFTSRSIPMWLETVAEHPRLAAWWLKYQYFTDTLALQEGAVTSRGKVLPSLRGCIQIPGTGFWVDPRQGLSLGFILPFGRRRYYEKREGMTIPQQVAEWMYETASFFGVYEAPWMYWAQVGLGLIDTNYVPPFSLIPQMDLVPRMSQRGIREWLARMHLPDMPWVWSQDWSIQDFLVERRMMSWLLEELQRDPSQAPYLIAQVKEALGYVPTEAGQTVLDTLEPGQLALPVNHGEAFYTLNPREDSELWIRFLKEVESDQNVSRWIGYWTGIYAKPYTNAEIQVIAARAEVNKLKDMINNEVGALVFHMDPNPQERYERYRQRKFETPVGWVEQLAGAGRWTVDPETGDQLFGTDRRELVAQNVHEDTITTAYWQSLRVASGWLHEQLSQLPVGAPSDQRSLVWDQYWKWRELIETHPMFADARRQTFMGYKPRTMIKEFVKEQWYYRIRETRPKYDPNVMDYSEWQARVVEWEEDIPAIARSLVIPFYLEMWDYATGGEGVNAETVEQFWVGNYPTTDERMIDIKAMVAELLTGTTGDSFNDWRKGNATLNDALNDAWKELYWDPYWQAMEGLSGNTRFETEREFKRKNPAPNGEELAAWVMENYPERWTHQELVDATVEGILTIDDRLEAKDPTGQLESQIWDILRRAGPDKEWLRRGITALGGDADDFTRFYSNGANAWRDPEEFAEFAKRVIKIATAKNLGTPTDAQVNEWATAQRLNDIFREGIEHELGDDFYQILNLYYELDTYDEKRAFREVVPEIELYWDLQEKFAGQYQLWAKYYNDRNFDADLPSTSTDDLIVGIEDPVEFLKANTPGVIREIEIMVDDGVPLSIAAINRLKAFARQHPEHAVWVKLVLDLNEIAARTTVPQREGED